MIYYKLWNPSGLINQLMSIELAVGIKEVTGSEITIYNVLNGPNRSVPIYSASREHNNRESVIDNSSGFLISDILDWKDKQSYNIIENNQYLLSPKIRTIKNLMASYYDLKNKDDFDFAEGRERIAFSDDLNIENTLGWYSRFFNNRSKELDHSISSVKFLPEYYELSEKIAKSLGDFNGAHLRLTDHVSQRVNTTKDMFDLGISKIDDNKPIVMCTDEPDNKLLKIQGNRFIMLDDYILKNFSKDFVEFRYRDEVSFGLLNNLVMHHSKKFVGTIGSTYTGYIHRGMNQKSDIEWNWFDFVDNPVYEYSGFGPYSWNGLDKMGTEQKQWFREWKESRISS
jgi:hypothetical protein